MLWLLIGYMFMYIYRPFEVWPILGELRIELVYMIGVGVYWLVVPQKRLAFNPLTLAVALMAAVLLSCALLSAWTGDCLTAIESWLKFLVFFLMLITVVHNEKDLQRLVVAFLTITAVYMLHSAWEFHCGRYVSRMGIGRLVGVDLTNGDPNAFAMTIVLSMVFLPACWRCFPGAAARLCLIGYMALGTYCMMMTGSRGAFVAYLLFVVIAVWTTPWRGRLLAVLLPIAPLLFLTLPGELQTRFETIINPDVGPKNAQQSAEGRIDGFFIGMRLWQENPIFGVGAGAWQHAAGRGLKAHNLYGQVAGELGTAGIVALGSLVFTYVLNIRRIRRACFSNTHTGPDFLYQLTTSLAIGLVLLLFSGLFGHNLLRTNWVLFAAFLIIARQSLEQRGSESGFESTLAPDADDFAAYESCSATAIP